MIRPSHISSELYRLGPWPRSRYSNIAGLPEYLNMVKYKTLLENKHSKICSRFLLDIHANILKVKTGTCVAPSYLQDGPSSDAVQRS